jgi:glyoxylase I family protein
MSVFSALEHFGLAARDTEKLARWYCEALGFAIHAELDNGPGKPKTYFVRLPQGSMIEILPAADPPAKEKPNTEPGWVHLAVSVSDFEAAAATLAQHGARPEGAVRDLPGGTRVRFYRDPEGNLLHIVFRAKPL